MGRSRLASLCAAALLAAATPACNDDAVGTTATDGTPGTPSQDGRTTGDGPGSEDGSRPDGVRSDSATSKDGADDRGPGDGPLHDGVRGDGARSDGARRDGPRRDGSSPTADGRTAAKDAAARDAAAPDAAKDAAPKDAAAPDAAKDAAPKDAAADAAAPDAAAPDAAAPATDAVFRDGPVRVSDAGIVITTDGGKKYTCYKTTCARHLLQCGDCIDNDGDGLVDSRDPECLGPCDNTEGPALTAGVGGNLRSNCKVDCFFDFGIGSGNDKCVWDHRCDPLQPELPRCVYDKKLVGTKDCPSTQVPKCLASCRPLTPNGCDCFGCCTFPSLKGKGPGGADGFVWIGARDAKKNGTCTLKSLLDAKKCPRCTPVAGCYKACGRCQLCIGKPTVPADCFKRDAGVARDATVATDRSVMLDRSVFDATARDGARTTDSSTPAADGRAAADSGLRDAGGGTPQCPGGEQPCGLPGQAACAPGFYCITGCCQRVVVP